VHSKSHIVVAGGGLVGLLLACVCKHSLTSSASVTLVEREFPLSNEATLDTRATALSADSKQRLNSWGLWSGLESSAAEINDIHVSRYRRFGSALLSAEEQQLDALGYVVENKEMMGSWLDLARSLGIDIRTGVTIEGMIDSDEHPSLALSDGSRLSASLLVVADGARSPLRESLHMKTVERAAAQYAIACNVAVSEAVDGRAFERFTQEGPIAFLPLPSSNNGQAVYNVIWCAHRATVDSLMPMSDSAFLFAMQETFGWRVGKLLACGYRGSWPLASIEATEVTRHRCVLMGNAAHTLHPVAGQGFNLSVRDISALTDVIRDFDFERDDARELSQRLNEFSRSVESDRVSTQSATSTLASLFDTPSPVIDIGSPFALSALDITPPLRKRIAQLGMGIR
jgi:2-octaprenyl-6-methoxyphenol hydroxylase